MGKTPRRDQVAEEVLSGPVGKTPTAGETTRDERRKFLAGQPTPAPTSAKKRGRDEVVDVQSSRAPRTVPRPGEQSPRTPVQKKARTVGKQSIDFKFPLTTTPAEKLSPKSQRRQDAIAEQVKTVADRLIAKLRLEQSSSFESQRMDTDDLDPVQVKKRPTKAERKAKRAAVEAQEAAAAVVKAIIPRVPPVIVGPKDLLANLALRFPAEKGWEGLSMAGPHSLEMYARLRELPVLMMRFVGSPKAGNHFGKYCFQEWTSVTAFWIEQLQCKPAMVRSVRTLARTGALYEVTLRSDVTTETLDQLPKGLVKVAPGIGFVLSAANVVMPAGVPVMIDPVPLMLTPDMVEAAVGESFAGCSLQNAYRVYENGVASSRVMGDFVVGIINDDGTLPEALLNPGDLKSFTLEMSVDGYGTHVHRRTVCGACASPGHIFHGCALGQRLMSPDMPVYKFLGDKQAVEATEGAGEPAQVQGSSGKGQAVVAPVQLTRQEQKVLAWKGPKGLAKVQAKKKGKGKGKA